MNANRSRKWMWMAVAGGLLALGSEAQAVIGRPLTPMSYAGVARRTVRRSAVVGGAYGAGAYGYGASTVYAAPPTTTVVTTLPAGCSPSVPCAGVVYEPQYQGTTLVYVRH